MALAQRRRRVPTIAGGEELLEGIVPGDYRITLRGPDHRAATVTVDDLRPGETRAVEIGLDRGRSLHGRVRSAEGDRPPTELPVHVRPLGPDEIAQRRADRRLVQNAFTPVDAEGRFDIASAPDDTCAVQVRVGAWFEKLFQSTARKARWGTSSDLSLPELSQLHGHVVHPKEVRLDGARVYVRRFEEGDERTDPVVVDVWSTMPALVDEHGRVPPR